MKKITYKYKIYYLLFLPLFFALLLAGCKKDPVPGRLLTMTVAAKLVITNGILGNSYKTINVKIIGSSIGNNQGWQPLGQSIEGFEYTEGYEYVLKVREVDIKNPMQDGSSVEYILVKLVSKTKK